MKEVEFILPILSKKIGHANLSNSFLDSIDYTMGVRGLLSWLKPYSTTCSLEELQKKRLRIAIDISYYMYKWQADKDKVLGFVNRLLKMGHRVILVFDGRAADGKQWEVQRRRQVREDEQKSAAALSKELEENNELTEEQKAHLEQKISEHQRRGWSLTRDLRHAVKLELYKQHVPMVKAVTEADGLLAAMSNRGDVDVVISGDMDVFAMGAKVQYAPIGDGTKFLVFEREYILKDLGLTDYQFRTMCAMCFTESREREEYLDIRQAYQGIRVYQSYEKLKSVHPEWLQEWPTDDHIFYHSVDTLNEWIREDQKEIYKCFLEGKPMPYTDE